VEGESLFLPELDSLQQRSEQEAAAVESEINPGMEETQVSPQEIPVVSRDEVEDYLASLYSKTGESETQMDPDILSRFSLGRMDKDDFSLVYNPDSLKNLEKDPQEGIQNKKPVGLLQPYGIAVNKMISGQFGSRGPKRASPQPLGQTVKRLQIKDLTPWAEQVLEKIERKWIFNPGQPEGLKGTVVVSVTISKNGDISNVEVIKSSGEQSLDISAVNAINMSIPYPGLPIYYPSESIDFTVEFEYDV